MIDIVIIGGGASGMMAAICAGRQFRGTSKSILLIEQKERLGKKVLATGNGKCNYTNTEIAPSCFFGDPELVRQTYEKFNHRAVLAFFREIGIYPKIKGGYCYPLSEQASSLVWALETEIRRLPVEIRTKTKVQKIQKNKSAFTVVTDKGSFQGKKLIIACGLKASPKLGSDGSLFPCIRDLGHHMTDLRPALCGFNCRGMDFGEAAGVRCDAKISLKSGGKVYASDSGELQFTDYGLSGIPVFQVSHKTGELLYRKKPCIFELSFLPEMEEEELRSELAIRRSRNAGFSAESLMMGLLPQKLIPAVLGQAGISMKEKVSSLTEEKINGLISTVKKFHIEPLATRDFDTAQVCAGGIPAEEINKETMESQIVPGLYFAGEVLDVDAICGGYNLQWAWSSGYTAGLAASIEANHGDMKSNKPIHTASENDLLAHGNSDPVKHKKPDRKIRR